MTIRDEIAAVQADVYTDKPGRIARLKSSGLRQALSSVLPYSFSVGQFVVRIGRAWVSNQGDLWLNVDLIRNGVFVPFGDGIFIYRNPPHLFPDPNGTIPVGGLMLPNGTVLSAVMHREDPIACLRADLIDKFRSA